MWRTKERSNLGMDLELLGLSLWKLAMSLAISVLLLTSKGEFPKGVCNRSSISLNGRWVLVFLREEEAFEVANVFLEGAVKSVFQHSIIGTLTILMHM